MGLAATLPASGFPDILRAKLNYTTKCKLLQMKITLILTAVVLTETLVCCFAYITSFHWWWSGDHPLEVICQTSFYFPFYYCVEQKKRTVKPVKPSQSPPPPALIYTFEPHACLSQRRLLPDRQQTWFDRWPGSVTGSLQRTVPVSTHFLLSAPLTRTPLLHTSAYPTHLPAGQT